MSGHRKEWMLILPAVFAAGLAAAGLYLNAPVFSEVSFPDIDTVQAGNEENAENTESPKTDAADAKKRVVKTDSSQNENEKKAQKQIKVQGKPADGTYTGSAICEQFGYMLQLKVTFQNGNATSIYGLNISGNEDPANEAYWQKAWKPMVKRILQAQSADVDTVSGATYSSNAVVSAYLDAYDQAVAAGGETKKTRKKRSKATAAPKETPVPIGNDTEQEKVSPTKIQDGTYTVTAACDPDSRKAFRSYQLTADVTFSGGKLTAISHFTSTDETNRRYYCRAAEGSVSMPGVVKQLIARQSAQGINAVSGATCSSKTIRNLYLLALQKAGASVQKESDEMAVQTPAPSAKPSVSVSPSASPAPGGGEQETAVVQDGTYTVSVVVWPDEWEDFKEYTLTADVTFENGQYVSMDHIQISDTSNQLYCDQAWNGYGTFIGLGQQLQDTAKSQYDVVSGATCSSYAFVELYDKALAMAREKAVDE